MRKFSILSVLLSVAILATAQLSIDETGTTYIITFDETFDGVNNGSFTAPATYSAETPVAGQLDRDGIQINSKAGDSADWPNPVTDGTDGKGISNGQVQTGQSGVYAFSDNGGSNRFVGFQANGSNYSPGAMILKVVNNSGFNITQLNISYVGKVFNDANSSQQINFFYGITPSDISTSVAGLDFMTSGSSTDTWISFPRNGSIKGINIASGQEIYLKWSFNNVTMGNWDEIGFDDIQIEALSPKVGFETAFTIQQEFGTGVSTVVTLPVTMEGPPMNSAKLLVNVMDGLAELMEDDYGVIGPSELNFGPTDVYPQTQNIFVEVLGDEDIEPNEDFKIRLLLTMGAPNVISDEHVVLIANDDGPGGIVYSQIAAGNYKDENMWNTERDGSGTYIPDPNNIINGIGPVYDIVVQSGHEVLLDGSKGIGSVEIETSMVEGDGILKVGSQTVRYLRIFGSSLSLIEIDGQVGDGINNDGISLEIATTSANIIGSGQIDFSEIRKVGDTNSSLFFVTSSSTATYLRGEGTVLYNNSDDYNFDIYVTEFADLIVTRGDVSIDGETGLAAGTRTGNIFVSGFMDIQQGDLHLRTNNPASGDITCAVESGGWLKVSDGQIIGNSGVGGAATATLIVEDNGVLELSGPGEVIAMEDASRNVFEFKPFSLGFPGSKVIYSGTADQDIEDAADYAILTIDGGSLKELEGTVTVNEVLDFVDGLAVLIDSDLIIESGGVINGANTEDYVRTNGTGRLSQEVGAGDVLFPVGNNTYNPIKLNNAGGMTDRFDIRVEDEVLTAGTTGDKVEDQIVNRTWLVSEAIPGGLDLDLTVQWNASDEAANFNRNQCFLSQYTGGWDVAPFVAASGSDPYTISRSGISTLSPFAVFSEILFPVELISFNAVRQKDDVVLQWETATEQNNDRFVIERSSDGRTFKSIGELPGAGTTTEPQKYRFVDGQPWSGLNYYRLRQIDFDGKFEFSPVRVVDFRGDGESISVYPVPAAAELTVGFGKSTAKGSRIRIYGTTGQLHRQIDIPAESIQTQIDLEQLPPGLYWLQWDYNGEKYSRRFIKSDR